MNICFNAFLFLITLKYLAHAKDKDYLPSIGIIGGGIGGASTAFWLSRLFAKKADIHLYESSSTLGGRLKTIELDGFSFEAGGSIIHPRNSYAKRFFKIFGLKEREPSPDISLALVKHDKEIILQTYRNKFLKIIQMLYFYKFDMIRLQVLVSRMLRDFDRIYDIQTKELCFSHPEGLLKSLNSQFAKYLNTTLYDVLKDSGMGEKLLNFANAALRTNYGQDNTHAFVGSVCVAGVQPGLWAIHDGNWKLVERFAQVSGATLHVNTKISKIQKNEKFTLYTKGKSFSHDIVIIAAPLKKNSLETANLELKLPEMNMHKTVATFVSGELNKSLWNFQKDIPEAILAFKSFFNSIGKQFPVNYNSSDEKMRNISVYKVFSNEELSNQQLKTLFSTIRQKKVISWQAYPEYNVPQLTTNFTLTKNLYFNNAIENLASAIEMSIISARNIAFLAYYNWKGESSKIDPNIQTLHTEL